MRRVCVNATVVMDDTGNQQKIPVILIEQDGRLIALAPLVDYLLENSLARSRTWMRKLCQIVAMLLDYTDANYSHFDKPMRIFGTFAHRVYAGTIGEDGKDPSNLYWLPKGMANTTQLLRLLSAFSDWMQGKYGTQPLNPWREATTYEEHLNWAAFINRSERSFLGHLDNFAEAAEAAKRARNILLPGKPPGDPESTKAFPEDRLEALLFEGFKVPGRQDSPDIVERYDWRGICITLLLNGGGLRGCEPFHLWVHDVQPDPHDPSVAMVRVYHPANGIAPKDARGPDGRFLPNRQAYLQARHPGYGPRHKASANRHAGWKNPKLSDTTQKFIFVHWFPREVGRLFLQAWKLYMFQRVHAGIKADKHPFLFVSFHGKQHGEPYTIDAFNEAHGRAVLRIGLIPAKLNGTTKHGHRHAYGQRAGRARANKHAIQAGLHHRSQQSQDVYNPSSIEQVTRELTAATEALASGETRPMVIDLDAYICAERKQHKRHFHKKGK